ncbi:MAG: hypothetical protein R2813_08600 [Flavobacteriales bacterium]
MILIVSGCRVDDELYRLKKTVWSPEIAIPVAHAKVSASDLLSKNKSELITLDEQDRITLSYDALLYSKSGAELLVLADKVLALIPGVREYELPFNESSIIEYLKFGKGQLQLLLEGPSRAEIAKVEIRISSLHLNGVPFEITQTNVTQLDELFDLTGAELFFGSGNRISAEFFVFNEQGADITHNYSLFLRFKNMVIKQAKGWFDNLILDFETDTISLDVFDNWKKGTIYLDDPRINISFSNSIGIPFTASVSTFDASKDGQGATIVPIDYKSALGDSFTIQYPSGDDIEGYVNSIFRLDRNNSNIRNVIQISPSELHYGFNLVTRHSQLNQLPGTITDTSQLKVTTQLELPFTCRIDNVFAIDTISVSTNLSSELLKVERALMEVTTENALPLGALIQVYLLDSKYNIIDSVLTDRNFLTAANIDGYGFVISPNETKTSIGTTDQQLQALRKTQFMLVMAQLETSDAGQKTVSFQGSNYLSVDLALRLKYKIQ